MSAIQQAADEALRQVKRGVSAREAVSRVSVRYGVAPELLAEQLGAVVLEFLGPVLAEFRRKLPYLKRKTVREDVTQLERTLKRLDSEPDSPMQVMRTAYVDTIAAGRAELARRLK